MARLDCVLSLTTLLVALGPLATAHGQPAAAQGAAARPAARVTLRDGERIVLLGATFLERMQGFNYFEAALVSRYPQYNLQVRNLGWSGDEVSGIARAVFGQPEDGFQRLVKDVKAADPTTIVLHYGGNEAHAGEAGTEPFRSQLTRLLATLEPLADQLVLLSPFPYESGAIPEPQLEKYNQNLQRYRQVIAHVAHQRNYPLIDLAALKSSQATDNGLHLTPVGYWELAPRLAAAFGAPEDQWEVAIDHQQRRIRGDDVLLSDVQYTEAGVQFRAQDRWLPRAPAPGAATGENPEVNVGRLQVSNLPEGSYQLTIDGQPVVTRPAADWARGVALPRRGGQQQVEQLREEIGVKNELYFHRYRPQNETYLFLFRKHEQGNNAVEVPQFEPLVAAREKEIARLRRPVPHTYQLQRLAAP